MTRKVAYGAAISLVAGIGLGAWLQPPLPYYGSGTTVVTPPQEQTDVWGGDVANAATLPYAQSETSPSVFQTASVSPPAEISPTAQVPEATVQPAVQTTMVAAPKSQNDADQAPWSSGFAERSPGRVAYNVRPSSGPLHDWAEDAAPARADNGAQDLPPPPRWQRPADPGASPAPERRPAMQDRRWDFRADGSAVPLDGGG